MILDYLKEIKNRIFLVIISWLISVLISYHYKETLLFLATKTLINNNEPLYFIATNLTEIITTYIQLSYFTATQFSLIALIYHLFIFLSPSLYKFEYNLLKLYLSRSIILGVLSLVSLTIYIIPFVWNFFLSFQYSQNSINLYFEGKINEYINFYMAITIACLIISQTVTLIFFFFKNAQNIPNTVKYYRKVFYIFFLLTATLLTPPDVHSQILILTISLIFYELLILILIMQNKFNLEAN